MTLFCIWRRKLVQGLHCCRTVIYPVEQPYTIRQHSRQRRHLTRTLPPPQQEKFPRSTRRPFSNYSSYFVLVTHVTSIDIRSLIAANLPLNS